MLPVAPIEVESRIMRKLFVVAALLVLCKKVTMTRILLLVDFGVMVTDIPVTSTIVVEVVEKTVVLAVDKT